MPEEVLRMVHALMREGYSESSAYAIAVEHYKKRHGHAPRMHQRSKSIEKANERVVPNVLPESNSNRIKPFMMSTELLLFEILGELKKVRELLEKK